MTRQIGKWLLAIAGTIIAGVVVWMITENWPTRPSYGALKAKLERLASETTTLARQTKKVDLDRVAGGKDAFESYVRRSIDVLEPLLREIENDDQFLENSSPNLNRAISRRIESLQKYRDGPYKYRKHIHQAACNLSIAMSGQLAAVEGSDDLEVCQPKTYREASCLTAFEAFLTNRFPNKAAQLTSLCFARAVN